MHSPTDKTKSLSMHGKQTANQSSEKCFWSLAKTIKLPIQF